MTRSNQGLTCATFWITLGILCSPGSPSRAQTASPVADPFDRLWSFLDRDGDGSLQPYEGAEALLFLAREADRNANGSLEVDEISAYLQQRHRLHVDERHELFDDLDEDHDGTIHMDEIPEELRPWLIRADVNDDGFVQQSELLALVAEETDGARFDVNGTQAEMHGVINASTPGRVLELILEHPGVDTIVMHDVPGSMDDEANLRAARLVRRAGLATTVPAGGEVASGGTDFFLAGHQRTADPGARFGVHSWSGLAEEGVDVPRDDPEHTKYLDYYREMEIPEEFYWYTLEAAPADQIHWMTPEEIQRFQLFTDPTGVPAHSESEGGDDPDALDIDTDRSVNGIVPLPPTVPALLRRFFDKYTRIVAPNGRPIHFFAQDGVTDAQLVRAREIMRFYLTDVPGTRFGSDKTSIANVMADNRAALVYFNTEGDAERAFRAG